MVLNVIQNSNGGEKMKKNKILLAIAGILSIFFIYVLGTSIDVEALTTSVFTQKSQELSLTWDNCTTSSACFQKW